MIVSARVIHHTQFKIIIGKSKVVKQTISPSVYCKLVWWDYLPKWNCSTGSNPEGHHRNISDAANPLQWNPEATRTGNNYYEWFHHAADPSGGPARRKGPTRLTAMPSVWSISNMTIPIPARWSQSLSIANPINITSDFSIQNESKGKWLFRQKIFIQMLISFACPSTPLADGGVALLAYGFQRENNSIMHSLWQLHWQKGRDAYIR